MHHRSDPTPRSVRTAGDGAGLRVVYSFPGRVGRAGIGSTAWHHVRALVDLGVEVRLYCGSCERPLDGAEVVETLRPAGMRIPYRLLGFERAARWHDARVARDLTRSTGRIDAVHAWPLGSLRTLRAAKRSGVASFLERPNTHTRHAYEVVARELKLLDMTLPDSHSHRASATRLAREEAEYAFADFLLCPSEAVASTFRDAGFPASKLLATQYGFDPVQFPNSPTEPSARGPAVVGFVGSCEPRKGLHYVLEAWQRSGVGEAAELRIYGEFVPGYRERLGDLIDLPGVRHIGFTDDVASAMRACDVVVAPSIEEGSALVTYEARASGCVLLASTASGARCTHEVDALLHEPGDVDTLARQLRLLVDDRATWRRLRAASLETVDQLTWEHAGRSLIASYRAGRDWLAR